MIISNKEPLCTVNLMATILMYWYMIITNRLPSFANTDSFNIDQSITGFKSQSVYGLMNHHHLGSRVNLHLGSFGSRVDPRLGSRIDMRLGSRVNLHLDQGLICAWAQGLICSWAYRSICIGHTWAHQLFTELDSLIGRQQPANVFPGLIKSVYRGQMNAYTFYIHVYRYIVPRPQEHLK